MAKNKSGQTATGAAIARYIEQYQPHETRLFNDPIIGHLLGQPFEWILHFKRIRNWMLNMFNKQTIGIYGGLVCRTKYMDEALKIGIHNGFRQIVILGAGLDTRAYRMPELDGVIVYEVDLPDVQEAKKKRLSKYLGSLPANVVYTPIDFNKQRLENVFEGSKLDLSKPVFYIWEGVTQYITAEAVRNTLHFISKSSPGSEIVFTYILRSVIDRKSDIPGVNEMMRDFGKKKAEWRFGIDPLEMEGFLKPFKLSVVEDVGYLEYQAEYVKPIIRTLDVSKIERAVRATITYS